MCVVSVRLCVCVYRSYMPGNLLPIFVHMCVYSLVCVYVCVCVHVVVNMF